MWRVVFHFRENMKRLIESGFDNQGQAEAWVNDGAHQRYGPTFWQRCIKIEVEEK